MKKNVFFLTCALAAMVALSSCNKIKDALFPSFDTTISNIQLTIPIITNTSTQSSVGSTLVNFNLDSVIKAKTSNQFSLSNVKSVKVTKVDALIPDSDQNNNMANFESANVLLSSNTNPSPATIASASIPDTFAQTLSIPNSNGPELKDYLNSTQLTYQISGKLRRSTTQEMTVLLNVTLHVD